VACSSIDSSSGTKSPLPVDNQKMITIFLKNLSIIQRYESHHSRQFFKTLAILLALRGTGQAGLARVFRKAFAQGKKDSTKETDG
jgi:hypothetical protein